MADQEQEQMRAIVAEAVAQGIRQAVSDPEMWTAALTAMQSRAQTTAGRFVLGGLATAAGRLFWLGLIGLGFYMVGGWSAVVAAAKALFTSGSH